jgi:hypothetical protein
MFGRLDEDASEAGRLAGAAIAGTDMNAEFVGAGKNRCIVGRKQHGRTKEG